MVEILVVEDEEEILDLLLTILKDLRISVDGVSLAVNVTTARNGKQAFDLISGKWFDAILSDIQMPVMNGLELLSNLRGLGKEIPLIFLTGFGDKSHAVRALRLGCYDFLDKPFETDRIQSVVRKAAELGYRARAIEELLALKLVPFANLPADRQWQLRLVFRSMLFVETHQDSKNSDTEGVQNLRTNSIKSLLKKPKPKARKSSKRAA